MADPRRTAWLLGAGFSRPLGGPLFSELLSQETSVWVEAWLAHYRCNRDLWPREALKVYEAGCRSKLWSNPEQALTTLEEALTDPIAREVVQRGMGNQWNGTIEVFRRELTQFVSIATTVFVDRINWKKPLPERCHSYRDWLTTLTEQDMLLSFNYDRAVENLMAVAGSSIPLVKLHGTVPEPLQLAAHVNEGRPVETIYMPGPQKAEAPSGGLAAEWSRADNALREAQRIVILGYSFPETDPGVLSYVLTRVDPETVDVVLGPWDDAERVRETFNRFFAKRKQVENKKTLVQQYLAETYVHRERGKRQPQSGA